MRRRNVVYGVLATGLIAALGVWIVMPGSRHRPEEAATVDGETTVGHAVVNRADRVTSLEALGARIGHAPKDSGRLIEAITMVDFGDRKVTDAELALVEGLGELVMLRIASSEVTDAGLTHLTGLKSLNSLYLAGARITDAGLRLLEPLRGLTILDLTGTGVGDPGLESIGHLRKIAGLDLTGTRITDAGLERLVTLEHLEVLRVAHTAVTDVGLASLVRLRSLKSVSLEGCKGIRGNGLVALATLPKLQVANLDRTNVAGSSLGVLQACPVLEEIRLQGTGVSDADLGQFQHMKALRHLYLYKTPTTEPGIRALAVAHPQLPVTKTELSLPKPSDAPRIELAPKYARVRNAIYGWRHGTALTLDVLTPERTLNGAAVLWIVSDGFYSRDEMITPELPWTHELLNRGYRVFVATHASMPRYNMEDAVEDVSRAVRFIRSSAAAYGIDPRRIGSGGRSAGAHLALMLGAARDQGLRFEDPITKGRPDAHDAVDEVSSRVQAVAAFYAPTDWRNFGGAGKSIQDFPLFGQIKSFQTPKTYDDSSARYIDVIDKSRIDQWLTSMSPIAHVTPGFAPTLLFHGDRDENAPVQQSRDFYEKLRAANVDAELVIKPGSGHGWQDDPHDRKTVADWFDKHLARSPSPR